MHTKESSDGIASGCAIRVAAILTRTQASEGKSISEILPRMHNWLMKVELLRQDKKNFQDLEIYWTNERKKWQKQQLKEQEERKIRELFTSLKNMLVIGGQSHYIK